MKYDLQKNSYYNYFYAMSTLCQSMLYNVGHECIIFPRFERKKMRDALRTTLVLFR